MFAPCSPACGTSQLREPSVVLGRLQSIRVEAANFKDPNPRGAPLQRRQKPTAVEKRARALLQSGDSMKCREIKFCQAQQLVFCLT